MSHKILKAFVVVLAAILLASCAPAPTPVPTQPPPTAAPRATQPPPSTATPKRETWKLTPMTLNVSAPSGGWIYYLLTFYLENQSNDAAIANFVAGKGTVETQEGITYEVSPFGWSSSLPIPPGFRFRDYLENFGSKSYLGISFQAGDKLHLTKITIPQYGAFDLTSVPRTSVDSSKMAYSDIIATTFPIFRNQNFPTLRPATDFRNLPATIEIPNKARITFKQPVGLEIPVEYQNLNIGNDTSIKMQCYIFDGIGLIRQDKGNIPSYGLGAGPGQTREVKMQFPFGDAFDASSKPYSAALRNVLTNAKLDCTGDVQAIFNVNMNVP